MRAARVRGCARAGVAADDADAVFLDALAIRVMQVPVMQVVDVAVMQHRGMTAVRAVLMRMVLVRVIGHGNPLFLLVRLCVDFFFVDRVALFRRVLERVRDELDDVAIGE